MTARCRLLIKAAFCAALVLLAGCGVVSRAGSYPDPNGPRNGDGRLVDPRTGITLPGQSDSDF
jgi:hypothetical protein